MLNSIGLENVGVDAFIRDKMPFLRSIGCAVFVNVFGFAEDEYVEVVEKLNDCDGYRGLRTEHFLPEHRSMAAWSSGPDPALTHAA